MKARLNLRLASAFILAALFFACQPSMRAQAARYLGAITAVSGDTLTVKTDAGDTHQVQVPSTAQMKRIEPGQTDLSKAVDIAYGSLAVGDRVLVTLDPNAAGSLPQAARIIAIKQADVARKQADEKAAWNQGVHGLVASVDAASGMIVVNVRAGAATKPVTVNVTKATALKRYAPGSVSFDQAQPAPVNAIKPGDQLWARGTRNADGTAMAADSVVSGSFLSVAGTVISTDPGASTITVKDLSTKKTVTVHVTADAQMRRLDDRMSQMLALRLKGTLPGGAQAPAGMGQGAPGGAGGQRGAGPSGGSGAGRAFSQSGGGGGDLESVLDRAPSIQLASLKKDDALMVVATQDASGVNVIKLLAGVEPLLAAPQASDLLANWSLNQGAPEAGIAQ